MIDLGKRRAIFELREKHKDWGCRRLAKAVGVSRVTLEQILKEGPEPPPTTERPRKLDEHLDLIRELYISCDRSVVRVGEELEKKIGKAVPYATLTSFCRHHGFGKPATEDQPTGTYKFPPGVESQHDTSPIWVVVGGQERLYQAASLKLGYSKNRYLKFYRRFRRLECRDFLVRGWTFFDGVTQRCVVDNTSVVVAHGTGKNAVMATEMNVFADDYGFRFKAHEKGDANRSAKVERDFDFIQKNFPKGRTFTDDADLNRQAVEWCLKKNAGYDRKKGLWLARLFQEEKVHLKPLPAYRPLPCLWHHDRRVDAYGFVCLDSNRYSAPNTHLGRELTLKETMDTVTLMDGKEELCVHARLPDGERGESRLTGHGRDLSRGRTQTKRQLSTEESWLSEKSSLLRQYTDGLRRRVGRRYVHQVRKLYALCHEYRVTEVETSVARAIDFDLYDVTRLEGMLLQEYGARLFGFRKKTGTSGSATGSVLPAPPSPPAVQPAEGPESNDTLDLEEESEEVDDGAA